jgi:hypothetical protein
MQPELHTKTLFQKQTKKTQKSKQTKNPPLYLHIFPSWDLYMWNLFCMEKNLCLLLIPSHLWLFKEALLNHSFHLIPYCLHS